MAKQGSYSGDPTSSTQDEVRFLVGDIAEPYLLSDPEISYLVGRHGSALASAAAGCDELATFFAQKVDKSIGALSVSASQRVAQYRRRADDLRQRMVSEGEITVFVGGLSKSKKRTLLQDEDAVQPMTQLGQDDHPGTATNVNNRLGLCDDV